MYIMFSIKKSVLLLSFIAVIMSINAQTYTSLNNENFAKQLKSKKLQLVDVRTPSEYASGHLPKAINIDFKNQDFEKNILKLKKKKKVAVYCRSGVRSKKAAEIISKNNYIVIELNTGISKWNGDIVTE
ncbi:MAG: rhodanese-like domain-containing protein [Bacteroidia bacterium]|nr:rhodanese-like domain-containing protein [Bacteroidia bacterium]